MEKIVVGFLGCGNIGCGVYKLLETYGAQMEKNEGVAFEVRKILVRSLNKNRAWAIPAALLTDRPEDVLDDPEIHIVMEFMGGEQPAASYIMRALANGQACRYRQQDGARDALDGDCPHGEGARGRIVLRSERLRRRADHSRDE